MDYFYLDCYKFENKQFVLTKTIDCKKTIKNFNVDLFPKYLYNLYDYQGKIYAKLEFYNKDTGEQCSDMSNYFLNLESENLEFIEDLSTIDKSRKQMDSFDILGRTSINLEFEKIGIGIGNEHSVTVSSTYTNDSHEQVERSDQWRQIPLLTDKPELISYFETSTENEKTIIFFKDSTDPITIASLLLPEGTNLFDNLRLESDYSVDDTEHIITSMEEFNQWYKYSEQNYETTLQKESKEKNSKN